MEKKYVILSALYGGVWSEFDKEFKGCLYASKFNTIQEAEQVIVDNNIEYAYVQSMFFSID